jgi:carbon-monoxide dehydrogenase small subunit
VKIPLILNGQNITLTAAPDAKLLDVLRAEGRFDVKCGCRRGLCGSCMILLDDAPVPACVIPVAAARNCSVVTLEHFKTLPVYEDIDRGFRQAGAELCGFCDAGKIFAAYSLITRRERLAREQILCTLSTLGCCCVDENLLTNAVVYAAAFRAKREKKEKNVR